VAHVSRFFVQIRKASRFNHNPPPVNPNLSNSNNFYEY
jgi:hypothetical protein